MITPTVIVVGSVNVDLTTHVDRLPRRGETVIGGVYRMAHGGKGANQAAAHSRTPSRWRPRAAHWQRRSEELAEACRRAGSWSCCSPRTDTRATPRASATRIRDPVVLRTAQGHDGRFGTRHRRWVAAEVCTGSMFSSSTCSSPMVVEHPVPVGVMGAITAEPVPLSIGRQLSRCR